jgi:hypothetical protein
MSDATTTLRASIARIIRRELARVGILIAAEYRVVTQSGAYVELQIVKKSAGLPDTSRVLSRPYPGYSPTYKLGSLVVVGFVQGDPSRPFIAWGPEDGSSTPPAVTIDADAIKLGAALGTVVREGDTVSIAPGNGSGPVTGIVSITLGLGTPTPEKSKVKA